jgi:succinate dehydrogenase / fumarate reductase flavoprotein subunit
VLDNADCTVLSPIERKESRGAQYRTDYPERNDEEWLRHINVSANGGEPEISYSEVTLPSGSPKSALTDDSVLAYRLGHLVT